VSPWADVDVVVAPLMRGRSAASGGDGGGIGGGDGDGIGDGTGGDVNARVLAHAARVVAALRESGLSAAGCPRGATPAAARAALERAGVPIRADVGAREAAGTAAAAVAAGAGTVALSLHPALELQEAPEGEAEHPATAAAVTLALRALRAAGRADGVPLQAAGEVCLRALDGARERPGRRRPHHGEDGPDADEDDAAPCWPPELSAAPAAPEESEGEEGDAEEEEAEDGGSEQQQHCGRRRQRQQQRRRRRRQGPDALLPAGWCDRLHLRRSWCAPHARWLLGVARGPCHCGGALGGHPALAEVLAAAESALCRRHWRRQQEPHAPPRAQLAFEWIPPLPPDGHAAPRPEPERASLFVTGFDERVPAAQARSTILAALAPLASWASAGGNKRGGGGGGGVGSATFRVAVSKGSAGRTRGWARVTVPAELAGAALAALSVGGSGGPLTASRALGRADALFPRLPPAGRLRLRLDPVAAFSVMDQPLAEKLAEALAALAAATAEADLGTAAGGGEEDRAPQPPPRPLHAVDACACAGGSALALARRFARVTAVELDADRAEDLAHNFAAAASWRPVLDGAADRDGAGAARGGPPPGWWVELRQPPCGEEEEEAGIWPRDGGCDGGDGDAGAWPPIPRERRAVVACADSLRLLLRPETLLGATATGAAGGAPLPPPLPPGFRLGGPPLDVVFFDPPWGGPQYREDDGEDNEDDEAGGAAPTDCHAPVVVAAKRAGAGETNSAPPGDLLFGGAPLAGACAALLASGRCRIVAVRLPAFAVDARVFAAKVARRLAAGAPPVALLATWGRSAVVVLIAGGERDGGGAAAAARAAAASTGGGGRLGRALKTHEFALITPPHG